jgi:hypothetical protein
MNRRAFWASWRESSRSYPGEILACIPPIAIESKDNSSWFDAGYYQKNPSEPKKIYLATYRKSLDRHKPLTPMTLNDAFREWLKKEFLEAN